MEIMVQRDAILSNIRAGSRKYCLECRVFFDPVSLARDEHATHYAWFLPHRAEEFDAWLDRIRARDEDVWGYVLDEDGLESVTYCPAEFTLRVV